jgi:glyoxylase-like metal-dependent hydrolase (beta-lactamase superfamily II)
MTTIPDLQIERATAQIAAAAAIGGHGPVVKAFFDEVTFTASYVVYDPESKHAAIIDSVLDYDPASGRTASSSANTLLAYVEEEALTVDWLLETHAHADHLSAAPYLQERLGGKLAIGRDIITVQQAFGKLFNAGADFVRDGSDFDHLFDDGDAFQIGNVPAIALHVPGHTSADLAYVIGGIGETRASFIGRSGGYCRSLMTRFCIFAMIIRPLGAILSSGNRAWGNSGGPMFMFMTV